MSDYSPEEFRQRFEKILQSDISMQEKINAGIKLVDSSRLFFEDADYDARQVLSSMTVRGGKTLPKNIVIREVWSYQDKKIQSGLGFCRKRVDNR